MKQKGAASSKALRELDEAFVAEGITVRDLVKTLNETRVDAMRFSTKDGAEVGPDHSTRFKAAESLLALKGLPAKGPPPDLPATPARIREMVEESDQKLCEELGL